MYLQDPDETLGKRVVGRLLGDSVTSVWMMEISRDDGEETGGRRSEGYIINRSRMFRGKL